MRRLSAQDGGTLTRILVTLLVFALLIFAGLYFFTKAQKPLALGNVLDARLAFSDVLQNHGTETDPKTSRSSRTARSTSRRRCAIPGDRP